MDGLTSRPLLVTDAPALLELELAAERVEPSETFADLAEVQESLAMPGVDLVDGSIAYLSGDRIVAAGFLFVRSAPDVWRANVFGGVVPTSRGRGIGRSMLETLQQRAAALRAEAGHADLPGELQVWIPGGREAATRLSPERASPAAGISRRCAPS